MGRADPRASSPGSFACCPLLSPYLSATDCNGAGTSCSQNDHSRVVGKDWDSKRERNCLLPHTPDHQSLAAFLGSMGVLWQLCWMSGGEMLLCWRQTGKLNPAALRMCEMYAESSLWGMGGSDPGKAERYWVEIPTFSTACR